MFAFGLIMRREVVVNFVDGSAIRGVLFRKRGPLLVLRNATYLEPGAEPLEVGEAVIERSKVLFIQAL